MKLELFHLIKRLPAKTRALPAKNYIVCLRGFDVLGRPLDFLHARQKNDIFPVHLF